MLYINAATGERTGEIVTEYEVIGSTDVVVPTAKSFTGSDLKAMAQEDKAHAAKEEQQAKDWMNYYVQL